MYASTLGVEEEYHMQILEVTLTQIGSTKKRLPSGGVTGAEPGNIIWCS